MAGEERGNAALTLLAPAARDAVVEHWRQQHPGGVVVRLRGTHARDRASFFAEAATAMGFPSWFGGNWDALWDCLTDLSWLDRPGYLLVVEDADQLLGNSPDQLPLLLAVLREAAAHWAGAPVRTPFATLLIDPATQG